MDHRQSPCCATIEKEQEESTQADRVLEEQYLGAGEDVVDPPAVQEAPTIQMPKRAKPMPTLSELVDKIPENLKKLLADQLRGEFKDVRIYEPKN